MRGGYERLRYKWVTAQARKIGGANTFSSTRDRAPRLQRAGLFLPLEV